MTMTVSTRIEHRPEQRSKGQRYHDTRTGKIPKHVKKDLTHENSVIIEQPMESITKQACIALRAQNEHKRKMKSTAAITTNGIITFGRDAQPIIKNLPPEKQDAIYKDIATAIAEKANTKLIGLVAHRDEHAPHAHYVMQAVNNDGVPVSQIFKSAECSELQDIAAEVMEQHGLSQIKRGKKKMDRIRDKDDPSTYIHQSLDELHNRIPRQLRTFREVVEDAKARLDEIYERQEDAEKLLSEKLEKVKYYDGLIEKAKAQAEHEQAKTDKLSKRINTYENRVNNLLEDIAKLENVDSKEVKEALENAGVISRQEVAYAGTEQDETQNQEPLSQDLNTLN